MEQLCYLGGPEYRHDAIRRAIADISKQDRFHFDVAEHRDGVQDGLLHAAQAGKPILISAELLTTLSVDRLTKAERLRALFGEIQILVCLRRPEDLLVSLYSEYVKGLNPKSQRLLSLEDWLADGWSDRRAQRITRLLDFSRLIRGYDSVFGSKPCVLLFEDLQSEPQKFARNLSDFVGLDFQRVLNLLDSYRENVRVNQAEYLQKKIESTIGTGATIEKLKRALPGPLRRSLKRRMAKPERLHLSDRWRQRIRAIVVKKTRTTQNLLVQGSVGMTIFEACVLTDGVT